MLLSFQAALSLGAFRDMVEEGQVDQLVCPGCGVEAASGSPGDPCPDCDYRLVSAEERKKHPRDKSLGRVIGGKYPLVAKLGQGGMGAVYRAIQLPVGREVALKLIRSQAGDLATIKARFEQEAAVVSRLKHPNNITLYDFGIEPNGSLFMVLELVEGHTLAQELTSGPLSIDRSARILADVLDALVEAHGLGLVHRDLKPENIMLVRTSWGTEGVKILDFGIAKVLVGDKSPNEQLTQTGMIFGTPRYMTPEQLTEKTIDARADLYAMGVILYECVTGAPPFNSDSNFDVLVAHRNQPPPPIPASYEAPKELRDLIMQALQKKPDDRPESAALMAALLREAAELAPASGLHARPLSDAAVASGRVSAASGPQRPGSTSREFAAELVEERSEGSQGTKIAVAVAIVLLGALGAVGWWSNGPGQQENTRAVAAPAVKAVKAGEKTETAEEPPHVRAKRLNWMGLELLEADRLDEAEARFNEALLADPGLGSVYYHLALLHARRTAVKPMFVALNSYLDVVEDPKDLARRVDAEPSFDKLRHRPEFQRWAAGKGVKLKATGRKTARRSQPPRRHKAKKPTTAKPAAKGSKAKSRSKGKFTMPDF